MKKILSPAYSLKLKNIFLFLNRGLVFIFYKWPYSQDYLNVDLTLCDVATSHQPKNNVEAALKCLPYFFSLLFKKKCDFQRIRLIGLSILLISCNL